MIDNIEILKDIIVPQKFYNRLSFGVQVLDEIFGGTDMPGILPGSSFLFTGMPGAGKSTMCLQLADLFQRFAGRNVLYNIGEENKHMIKLRANRIGITGNFSISHETNIDNLVKLCRDNDVEILFQDSLQSLEHPNMTGIKLLKYIVKELHGLAKEDDTTVFIIGHITKGGNFAGPQEIKHDVDVHAHLRLNPTSGNRIFELQKNRFGPATVPFEFILSANGLDFKPVVETIDSTKQTSKSSDRREMIHDLIRDSLIRGEKISGYCFERFSIDCSGGFWRGMLTKVCAELKSNGHIVGEVRINGRTHSFIEV